MSWLVIMRRPLSLGLPFPGTRDMACVGYHSACRVTDLTDVIHVRHVFQHAP